MLLRYAPLLVLLWQDAKSETVVVDLEILKSKHIAVQVKVNGEGPFRMIFDTGSPVTLFSTRLAKKAGIKGGGGMMGAPSTADSIEIGALKAEKIPVMVFDHPTVKLLANAVGELDGIIGFSFFSRYRVTIDYQASKLSLTPCDYQPTDVMARMQEKLLGGNRKEKKIQPRPVVLGLALAGDDPVVASVAPASPAALAGLKEGDRITLLDGRWVQSAQDVADISSILPAGEAVSVNVTRDGKDVELTLTPKKGL